MKQTVSEAGPPEAGASHFRAGLDADFEETPGLDRIVKQMYIKQKIKLRSLGRKLGGERYHYSFLYFLVYPNSKPLSKILGKHFCEPD